MISRRMSIFVYRSVNVESEMYTCKDVSKIEIPRVYMDEIKCAIKGLVEKIKSVGAGFLRL